LGEEGSGGEGIGREEGAAVLLVEDEEGFMPKGKRRGDGEEEGEYEMGEGRVSRSGDLPCSSVSL
jgi:hypothetical protein